MKVNLIQRKNENLNNDEFNIEIQYSDENIDLQQFIDYIHRYPQLDYFKKVIVSNDYELLEIEFKDIVKFYSDKKYNYCKTKTGQYRIKSKLYELEKMDSNLLRISKNCIINIQHVEKFDISETGKIVIILDDYTQEVVSRRKIKDVMQYLDERSI